MSLQPLETLPLEQIACAVRAKGIDFYDWCIDVETVERDYIRVRPPSQAPYLVYHSAVTYSAVARLVYHSAVRPPSQALYLVYHSVAMAAHFLLSACT